MNFLLFLSTRDISIFPLRMLNLATKCVLEVPQSTKSCIINSLETLPQEFFGRAHACRISLAYATTHASHITRSKFENFHFTGNCTFSISDFRSYDGNTRMENNNRKQLPVHRFAFLVIHLLTLLVLSRRCIKRRISFVENLELKLFAIFIIGVLLMTVSDIINVPDNYKKVIDLIGSLVEMPLQIFINVLRFTDSILLIHRHSHRSIVSIHLLSCQSTQLIAATLYPVISDRFGVKQR